MKRKPIIYLLFCAMSLSANAQNYKLVWSDEFNENSLNKNWNVEVVDKPYNNELQCYTNSSSNVNVENGNLIITARRESRNGKSFTSGRINSCNKVNFKHGKIEARIKMPKLSNGLWPAFWMMGEDPQNVGWPACGEIDIMEAGHSDGIKNSTQERLFSGCIHWGSNLADHRMWTTGAVTSDYDITGDYHIFTAVWDDSYLRFYLDNSTKPYYEATITNEYDSYNYFHKPFYILFNLAVGGDYPDIHDVSGVTALPTEGSEAKMYVDYVRIYQEEDKVNVAAPGVTGMNEIMNAAGRDTAYYTIDGMKLNSKPNVNGIYIHNGKKFIN
jgi:beta-glucanase (GH16 family)